MAFFPRQLVPEIRSALRLLEEPLLRPNAINPRYAAQYPHLASLFSLQQQSSVFSEPSFKEDGNNYLIQAELPGVKKENLTVEFADGGELLIIKGSKGDKAKESGDKPAKPVDQAADASSVESASVGDATSTVPTPITSTETTLSNEDSSASIWNAFPSLSSEAYKSFSNSFRFPKPVDVEKVQAKYEDGILRLVIPKKEKDNARKTVQIL